MAPLFVFLRLEDWRKGGGEGEIKHCVNLFLSLCDSRVLTSSFPTCLFSDLYPATCLGSTMLLDSPSSTGKMSRSLLDQR